MAAPSLFPSSRAAANLAWLAPEIQPMSVPLDTSRPIDNMATTNSTTHNSHRPATPADKRRVYPAPAITPPRSPATPDQRKLVTVRRVQKVDMGSHKFHDKVVIDGWTVAAARHSVREGQLAIFIEPDALLPAVDEHYWQFSQAGNRTWIKGKEYFRVATKCLGSPKDPRSQWVSQGLVLKLEDFPEINADVIRKGRLAMFEGEEISQQLVDYSDMLGVTKWEPHGTTGPNGNGNVLVKIPSFIKRTDTERVQNCLNLFTKEKYKHIIYQETIKLDGSSMSVYFIPKTSKYFGSLHRPHPGSEAQTVLTLGRFGVCSKNIDLPYSKDCPYWKEALANNLPAILEGLHQKNKNGTIAIQGELVGPGINGNHHSLPENSDPEFHVFSIWDIQNLKRWDPRVVKNFSDAHNLKHVKVMGYHKLHDIAESHEDLISLAEVRGGEGIVFKSCVDGRWFKVLSPQWIVEQGDEKDAREANKSKTGGEKNNISSGKKNNASSGNNVNITDIHATSSGQVEEGKAEVKSFGQQQADDYDTRGKDRPRYTEVELREAEIQEEKMMMIENWLDNATPDDAKMKAEEALVTDHVELKDTSEGTAEEALVTNKPEDIGERTAEEALIADEPKNAGEGAAEDALVADKPEDTGKETSECVTIQDVGEKSAEKKAGKLSDTLPPKEFDNVQDFLDAAVTWLGQPMSHREAIEEIGRIILTEMAINKENIQASMKDLAEVVLDELKFVATDESIAHQEMPSKDDAPTNIAPTVPDTPKSPTSPDTPTTFDAPITAHETNLAMEPVIVPEFVTGPVQQNAMGNPTPPASEHTDEQNVLAGVNWDDYKVIKRGGQLVCIRREDYVPRSPPSLYPSAEEMARRREKRRRSRR
ncbi:uncharacterized protein B0T23DRAFT_208081 [Neurospora hispaniola]|uniref:RNA ligase domain-containing protein n=1 Tax=Neurospora hispaniola TaxID=588809 RepID=A0AAJ0I1A4_9PEZI|nr:hypothetical protein B0T23DRAFT_208081 [Neurospora hispaniola]